LKKYSAQYAIGGLAQIAEFAGLDEAAAVARSATAALWASWARALMHDFGIKASTPPEALARLVQRVFELLGDELALELTPEGARLRHERSRLKVPEYDGWDIPPAPILEAFASAWSTVSRAVGPPVQVTVDRGVDGLYALWSFRSR
jgi:hypothetical protein